MTPTAKHILAWPGMAVLASVNGIARDLTYGRSMSEDRAHLVSTFPLLAMLGGYLCALGRLWPLRDRQAATKVGVAWLGMTLLFEFGLGRLEGKSWSELFRDYNVGAGRIWPLVLVVIAGGPEMVRRLSHEAGGE